MTYRTLGSRQLLTAAAVASVLLNTAHAFSLKDAAGKEINAADASFPDINWGPLANLTIDSDAIKNELILRGLGNLTTPWDNKRRLQDHNAGGCTNVQTMESMIVLCALALMLDVTPGFKSEGCTKVEPYCKAICDPATLATKKDRYQKCYDSFNPSSSPDQFGGCFFPRMIDNIIDAFQYTGQLDKPVKESVDYLCDLWDMPGCPICVAFAISNFPCDLEYFATNCKRTCKKCQCQTPQTSAYTGAASFYCQNNGTAGYTNWGQTCVMTCNSGKSANDTMLCENGLWSSESIGSEGKRAPVACKSNCPTSGTGSKPAVPTNGNSVADWTLNRECKGELHAKKNAKLCAIPITPHPTTSSATMERTRV
jgi:hypothetical protein